MKPRNPNSFRSLTHSSKRFALPTLALTLLTASHISAQTWDGGGVNSNWNTAANWVGDVAPVANNALTFGGTTQLSAENNFANNTNFTGLTFNDTAGAFILTGATINIQGAITNNDTDLQTINIGMRFNGFQTFNTAAGDITMGGVLGTTGAAGFTKIGTKTLTLANTNTYVGTTTLNSGTLALNYGTGGTNGSKLSDTTALNLNGGTLELSGGSHVEVVVSTTLNNGGTFIKRTSGTSTLSMGAINFAGGGIDFSADSIATTTSTVTNGILSQRATVAGANFAMKSGSNIVAYDYLASGSTGYTGGAMVANTNYALQTAGGVDTLAAATGGISNTLKIANTTAGTFALGVLRLDVGAILFAGSANYAFTFTGGGRLAQLGNVHNYGTGGATLTLAPLTTTLSHYGTGKTILNGAAYNNNTLNINGGTVQLSNNLQIGVNSADTTITLNNGTLLADTVGGNVALNNGSFNRLIALGNGGGTLDVIGGNKLTVSGVISGAGNSLIVGSTSSNGTVELTAANSYSGTTSVNGGKLLVTNTIGSSAVTVNSAGAILASDTAATIGASLKVSSGAILAVGDAANATTATATVLGATTFNNNSIFSWDINAAGTSYDKLITTGVAGEASAGDAVFRIVVADTSFLNGFWATDQSWNDIFTTDGSAAIANWATTFGNAVSVVNSSFSSISPSAGSFSITGSTLNWTAVPEPSTALAGLLLTAGLLRRRRA